MCVRVGLVFLLLETESRSLAQSGLELAAILLPQPLMSLDYRHEPSYLAQRKH